MNGMVRHVGGGVYTVALESSEIVEASLRGRLKLEKRAGDQVVIGDRVHVEAIGDGAHVIEEVLPRETAITRSRFGGRSIKVLVANADRMLVVVAAAQPKPHRDLIDRLLVVGESGGVPPVIVVNKMDLEGAAEVAKGLERVYLPLGYDMLRVSALVGEGMDRLAEQLCEGISALAGPSGVGKSSLVNTLEPEHALRTGELSRKGGTGRHTTVSSQPHPAPLWGIGGGYTRVQRRGSLGCTQRGAGPLFSRAPRLDAFMPFQGVQPSPRARLLCTASVE